MKKKYLCGFILPMLFFSCVSTPLPSGGKPTVPEDFFGIVHAARTNDIKEEKLLEQMGAKWVLNTFYWGYIEFEKNNFDFSFYDIYVNEAKRQGKKIIGVLGYGSNYSSSFFESKYSITKKNMSLFLRYVEETVKHFQGQVDVWCIWNEPNILFWRGKDSEYFNLTKLTADVIRKTDPNVYIIGGAFCRTPSMFIKKMHRAGAVKVLDALAFHPYDLNPSGSMRLYDKFIKTLSEINYTGSIWVTEVGFPTGGWYPNKVSNEKFPDYVVKTIVGGAARGARVLLWYQMFDSLEPGKKSFDSEDFFGLNYKDFRQKPGSFAYELCARFLPGSRYTPELPQRENLPSNIVSFCFLNGISGDNTLILWNDKKKIQKIGVNLHATALLHDISTGLNTPLPADSSIDVSNKPLFITWRGVETPIIFKKQ